MIKTKLILVDGITGSGKSTTAHYIARQLNSNGIKAKWYQEEEKNHPLHVNLSKRKKKEDDVQYGKRFIIEFVKQWEKFVKKIQQDDTIYIVECFFFQYSLLQPIFMDLDKKIIKEFLHKIYNTIKSSNPVLIHFYQEDVGKAMHRNWRRRGKRWKNWMNKLIEQTPYCKNRKLKGSKASIKAWDELTNISKELYNEFDMKKLQIENSKQKWNTYKEEILNFIKIEQKEEVLYKSLFDKYCDEYMGKGNNFKLYKKNGRLCIDGLWPGIKLIPVSDNEFDIEGLPISFKFYKYKRIKKVKTYKAGCYLKEGDIANKYIPLKINDSILELYCDTYWCEKEKLERKIILKAGKLYYSREKGNESELIPTSKTKFMISMGVDNEIEFKKIKGEWQFTFYMKGKKPTHSLFVKKK